jgi:hypothetical protein
MNQPLKSVSEIKLKIRNFLDGKIILYISQIKNNNYTK